MLDIFTNDGILIESRGEVRTIDGMWTVLVVLQQPTIPNVKTWLDTLKQVVHDKQSSITQLKDRQIWLTELYRIALACYGRGMFMLRDYDNLPPYSLQIADPPTPDETPMSGMDAVTEGLSFSGDMAPGQDVINGSRDVGLEGVYVDNVLKISPSRQDKITVILRNNTNIGRKRRGLFNFVGVVAKSLFGVAMASDLDVLKQNVEAARKDTKEIYNNQQQLVTVFDQTKDMVNQNRFGIRELQTNVLNIYNIGVRNAAAVSLLSTRVDALTLAREIDVSIDQLWGLADAFSAQQALFHRQRVQLERGWLTPDIFPPAHLQSVLRSIQDQRLGVVHLEWLYEYVKVTPVWETEGELVFRVLLPGLSQTEYLHFKLHYFYVSIGNEHLRKINGGGDVAVSTASGNSFEPTNDGCIGYGPRVCRPRKVDTRGTCETDLVTGEGADKCSVSIIERENRTIDVYREGLDSDKIIILPYETTSAIMRCLGLAPTFPTFVRPTRVTLSVNCSLETPKWRVSGIRHAVRDVHITFDKFVNLPELNISWPRTLGVDFVGLVKMTKLQEVAISAVPVLHRPAFHVFINDWWSSNRWYVWGAIMLLIFITVLGVMAYCVFMKRKKPSSAMRLIPAATCDEGGKSPFIPSAPQEEIEMRSMPLARTLVKDKTVQFKDEFDIDTVIVRNSPPIGSVPFHGYQEVPQRDLPDDPAPYQKAQAMLASCV
jgi:hypothetical protein